jgi:diacylglycerol kinase family enzyme
MIMKPEDGYIAYIVNPKSGASSSKFIGMEFWDYLIERGFQVRVNLTRSLANAGELAAAAAADSACAMAVVVGGDGTVREVARGIEGSSKPLLIIPAGTENLLANELGFDLKTETTIKTFEDGFMRGLDLGVADGRCFTSIAGFGFDGAVVESVSGRRKGHIDHFDYFWPIWRTFWSYRFYTLQVAIDGEDIFDGPGLVFVGNISRYAIGLHILRKADYSDGLLDVCIYKCASRLHLLKHSAMTVLKQHHYGSDVIYRQGKIIKISSEADDVPTEIDGDPGPRLPIEIKIVPQAVKVMVPRDAKPAGITTRFIRALG